MTKHVLIICRSCSANTEENTSNRETDGMRLFNRLKELHEQWSRKEDLTIETTGCLCICEKPCAIAYVSTHKPTYLFGDLSPLDSASDLLTASELYLDSEDGMVPALKLPAKLRPHRIARIPPAS